MVLGDRVSGNWEIEISASANQYDSRITIHQSRSPRVKCPQSRAAYERPVVFPEIPPQLARVAIVLEPIEEQQVERRARDPVDIGLVAEDHGDSRRRHEPSEA